MAATVRRPAVAGTFYPGDPRSIDGMIAAWHRALLARDPDAATPRSVRGIMVPHAGWRYSGRLACETFARIVVPNLAILIGPAHSRGRTVFALQPSGTWELPGTPVPVDPALTEAIRSAHPLVELDAASHAREHCLEVQVPFLRWRNPAVRIAALVSRSDDLGELRELGEALARVIAAAGEPALLVASTDMSHYIPAADAARLDGLALEAVRSMDPARLVATCRSEQISMCGFRPTAAALAAVTRLGASGAVPTGYTNSAEGGGDEDSVVGYAGMLFV